MAAPFRIFDFTKLTPYLGTETVFEDGARPFIFSIESQPLIYTELRRKLDDYLERIQDATKGNFLSLSLYNLMYNRFYGTKDPQIVRHETHFDELKWWQQLIKTIKYNNPNAWATLPLIEIRDSSLLSSIRVEN